MDFSLSSEQNIIYNTAREFGADAIAPNALDWEKFEEIPKTMLKAAGELGFAAMYVPESDGGTGMTRLDSTLVFEALALACPSVSSFISIHNMCAWMISKNGTSEQKQKHLVPLLKMDKICSYCLTEPGSGSDAAALAAKAVRTNEGYKLSGTKAFTSGGGYSDLYIVMARSGVPGAKGISAFLVQDGLDGLTFGKKEQKMGWKAQPTAQVEFNDCLVESYDLLGEEGRGFNYAMEGLDGGRLNIAAAALGGAQQALNIALDYTNSRVAFGRTLNKFQSLQFRLADMELSLIHI